VVQDAETAEAVLLSFYFINHTVRSCRLFFIQW